MDNQQFRRLLLDQSSTPSTQRNATSSSSTTLGSRQRSSIPMTPRSVGGAGAVDFARQMREQHAGMAPPPAKKFKSSAAPKGSRLAAGYTDRAKTLREGEIAGDDKEKRVKALEEQFKLGQISEDLFIQLRDQIVGGDVNSVHLVKGLDRKLLERVRKGEDVMRLKESADEGQQEDTAEERQEGKAAEEDQEQVEEEVDIDAVLDTLQAKATPQQPPKQDKPKAAPAQKKRTRDDILRELRAARQQSMATEQPQPQARLDSRFKKIEEKLKPGSSRLEVDERGREVLVTMGQDGNIKRKVRKAKVDDTATNGDTDQSGVAKSDSKKDVLGADFVLPEAPKQPEPEPDDGDIFADVGIDYDPLGDARPDGKESDSGSDSESESDTAIDEPGDDAARLRRKSSSVRSSISRSRSRSKSYSRSRSYDSRSRSRSYDSRSRSRSRSQSPLRQRRPRSQSYSRSRSASRSQSNSRSRSSSSSHSRSLSRSPVHRTSHPPAQPSSTPTTAPRNYFNEAPAAAPQKPANPLADPSIAAALKRAAQIAEGGRGGATSSAEKAEQLAQQKRRAEMLANVDRDAEDMDVGFGGSRAEDAEDGEGRKVKLSEWGELEEGETKKGKERGQTARKRGKKKRKGDGDGESVADVMAAVARRKE